MNPCTELVTFDNDSHAVLADSRVIAKQFGKLHKNVLRDIRVVLKDVPADFAKLNFELCSEINSLQNGKPQQFYRMTERGFALVVMGFTGAKAMAMKVAFLEAFARMAEFIRTQAAGAWAAFNHAYQQHLADKRHVSSCGRDMRRWQDVKPSQLRYLEQLHPQLALFPELISETMQ